MVRIVLAVLLFILLNVFYLWPRWGHTSASFRINDLPCEQRSQRRRLTTAGAINGEQYQFHINGEKQCKTANLAIVIWKSRRSGWAAWE
ncbi:hypothetical protein [Nostoc sp.]|uniref:hypothetical protein n=1 Tax=Nostoc sp. TaxID=1180 RepID=UPI002FFCDD29